MLAVGSEHREAVCIENINGMAEGLSVNERPRTRRGTLDCPSLRCTRDSSGRVLDANRDWKNHSTPGHPAYSGRLVPRWDYVHAADFKRLIRFQEVLLRVQDRLRALFSERRGVHDDCDTRTTCDGLREQLRNSVFGDRGWHIGSDALDIIKRQTDDICPRLCTL